MGKILLGSMLVAGAVAHLTAMGAKPNVVFFIVDDMGWQDTSVPFWTDTTVLNRTFRTPNMERLVERGAKFTNAYASAVSSPTRVSLMTGMNPTSHRVSNWTLRYDISPDRPSDVLDFPAWNVNGLQPIGASIPRSIEATTLPELLRANGYHTIHVGKAHFGSIGTPGENPLNLGFDVNVAGHAAGGLASYLGELNFGNDPKATQQTPFAVPGLEKYWGEDIFVTEALTREALLQLDHARTLDKPFYLYMSHYAIHTPWNRDSRFAKKYLDQGFSNQWANYAALVEGMDKSLGDLMDYLDEHNLTDNTIIFFMSDNGGLSVAGREKSSALGEKVNYPLHSGKGSAYEGGVRVPLIVSMPDTTKQNITVKQQVDVSDMLPTILSMVGVQKYKTKQRVDGIDFSSYISNVQPRVNNRKLYWHFPCKWDADGPGIGTYSSIINGNLKLIHFYDTGRTMLFNLEEDIFEIIDHSNNSAYAQSKKVLLRDLTSYLKRTKAQMPRYKDGRYCRYPNGDKYKLEE